MSISTTIPEARVLYKNSVFLQLFLIQTLTFLIKCAIIPTEGADYPFLALTEVSMRNLVLSILMAFLALPVFAEELACKNTPDANPAPVFVQWVSEHHPELTEAEAILIAQAFEAASLQSQLAKNENLSDVDRAFASRSASLIMSIAAVQMYAFEALPQMQSVLERMKAEKAAGLKRVSPELEPDVRHTAHVVLTLGQTWAELVSEANQLHIDRFLTVADSGNFDGKRKLEVFEHTLCSVKAGMVVMKGVVDLVPSAVQLAYVKNLNY